MLFRVTQIYGELDTSFKIHHQLLKLLLSKLNGLNLNLDHFNKTFEGEFTLFVVLTATRKSNSFVLNGPKIFKKTNGIEFYAIAPFQEFDDFQSQVIHVLDILKISILNIFEKYKTDASGVEAAFEDVKVEYLENIENYKC